MAEILVQVSLEEWDFKARDALKVRWALEDAIEENIGEVVDSGIGMNGNGLSVMDVWVKVENGDQSLEEIHLLLQNFQLEKITTVRIVTREQ